MTNDNFVFTLVACFFVCFLLHSHHWSPLSISQSYLPLSSHRKVKAHPSIHVWSTNGLKLGGFALKKKKKTLSSFTHPHVVGSCWSVNNNFSFFGPTIPSITISTLTHTVNDQSFTRTQWHKAKPLPNVNNYSLIKAFLFKHCVVFTPIELSIKYQQTAKFVHVFVFVHRNGFQCTCLSQAHTHTL